MKNHCNVHILFKKKLVTYSLRYDVPNIHLVIMPFYNCFKRRKRNREEKETTVNTCITYLIQIVFFGLD